VPSDRDIPRSVNEGTPIVLADSKSQAAQAFTALAQTYVRSDVNGANSNGNGRSRGRLFRRKA
jgi:MinD-like ATPase involved in chromosome partitioning or flagellar assembly